jgi:glycosyltransferase involved in cell wall biosynthesis
MRIITLICARNEADRYLTECLDWNGQQSDELVVFDDRSTDNTLEVALACGATPILRTEEEASFVDNEGLFRMAAWRAMERTVRPEIGDWIVCLDADEFLVGDLSDLLEGRHEPALKLHVHECFGAAPDGTPLIRKDGFWGDIWGARIGRYQHGFRYAPVPLGGGSLPEELNAKAVPAVGASILHYGYFRDPDRRRKYSAYMGYPGRHSVRHVESIMATPSLERWTGEIPLVRECPR